MILQTESTEEMQTVCFRLPARDVEKIDTLCKNDKRTRSNMLCIIVSEYLSTQVKA